MRAKFILLISIVFLSMTCARPSKLPIDNQMLENKQPSVFNNQGLWKGYGVTDKEGKQINQKVQQFLYFDDNSIFLLNISELLDMKTGEVVIKSNIFSSKLVANTDSKDTFFEVNGKPFSIETKSKNELIIINEDRYYPFQFVEEAKPSSMNSADLITYLKQGIFQYCEPTKHTAHNNLQMEFQEDRKVKYTAVGENRSWESNFSVIEFGDFLFLKGITSPTYFISSQIGSGLTGWEMDYRYDPIKMSLCHSNMVVTETSNSPKEEQPFEIFPKKITINDCLSQFSKNELKQKVGILKGVVKDKKNVTEVQHSYEGHWAMFHDESPSCGFSESTFEELLRIDPSLCYIVNIPKGYYAARKNKNDDWYIYKHEERMETDSSFIFKKAFLWNNTYRIINELKKQDIVYYEDYYLDTRILRNKSILKNSKPWGIESDYDENGKLVKETNHDTGQVVIH